MATTALAQSHYRHFLDQQRTLQQLLAEAPTPLSVFQHMARRLSEENASDAIPIALERLPKRYPGRVREYQQSAEGQTQAVAARRALAESFNAQARLLHADGLLSDEHRLMAKSVYQWPAEAERARHYGPVTRVYALQLADGRPCVGSLLLTQAAHTPLHHLEQPEDVGKLLLFTPLRGLETFDNLAQLHQADLLAAVAPGLRERDIRRAATPLRVEPVADDAFAWLWAGWQRKPLDDFADHLRQRALSPLQGVDWVQGMTAAVDQRDAFAPHTFLVRRVAALLSANEPAWLRLATPQARQTLAHRTRRVARYALQWHHLMSQLPSLQAFAKARVEGQLRRHLGRRIDIEKLYVSEARVVGLLPKLWKGLPWLIYSEIKHGRDLTALPDKALSNISSLDVDYWLTAMIVDRHGQEVPGLNPNLIRQVVQEVDVGGTYPGHLRALIDTAPQLNIHAVFAHLQQAELALQRQRAAMGAPLDPTWAAALQHPWLPRQHTDAALDARVEAWIAQAEAASTSNRESDLHIAKTLCTAVAATLVSAVNPWAGLAVNGLLGLPAIVSGVRALRHGDYEHAMDEIGGALANLSGSLLDLRGCPVALFREAPEQLQPHLLPAAAEPTALPPVTEADVSLQGLQADDDGVYHLEGRHYIRQIDSPTHVRTLEVDYSRAQATYRLLAQPSSGGFRQAIVRDASLAWKARHAPSAPIATLPAPDAPPRVEETVQGMDPPAPLANQPGHWLDPELLAQAGLDEGSEAAFLEAAYYLNRDNYRFTEEEILAPAPPAAEAQPDVLLQRARVELGPRTLSSPELTLTRHQVLDQQEHLYTLSNAQLAPHHGHIEPLIELSRNPGHNNNPQHTALIALNESVISALGYRLRGILHHNTLPVMIFMHPQSGVHYAVYPRVLTPGTRGRIRLPQRTINNGRGAWEPVILDKANVQAEHLLPELIQAHVQDKLLPVISILDLGATVGESTLSLLKVRFINLHALQ